MDLNSSVKFNVLEKLNLAKKAITVILEVLNAKFAGELKKDLEKEVKFLYSKFS